LSTHILPEVQAVCDRVVVINKGKIIADGKTSELVAKTAGVSKYSAELTCTEARARKILSETEGVLKILEILPTPDGVHVQFESDLKIDARKTLFNKLKEEDVCLLTLSEINLTLEDIFIKLLETNPSMKKEANDESNI
jgi:ABC-2 type transport system ATP-binding protein